MGGAEAGAQNCQGRAPTRLYSFNLLFFTSVGEPDPDPLDPHDFRPLGSGSISHWYGSGSESFLFLIKVLSGLK